MTSSSLRMEEKHAMTSGVVPVRPPSYLPQMVKLPRRYEKAALGDPKTARHRKVSLCGPPLHMRQSFSDRVEDLMTAIMWVKQELICLRQNDILLKRQFLDIHDSIEALQLQENAANNNFINDSFLSSSLSAAPLSSALSAFRKSSRSKPSRLSEESTPNHITTDNNNNNNLNHNYHHSLTGNTTKSKIITNINCPTALNHNTTTSPSISLSSTPSPAQSPLAFKKKHQQVPNGLSSGLSCSSHSFLFHAVTARVSSSATVLNHHNDDDNSDEDSDGDDVFDTNFFRPRTSSMRTSRDLAALARRRGSKDLV